MARSAQDILAFRNAFQTYLNRQPEQAALDAFMNSTVSTPDRVAEVASSPEALNVKTNQVRSQFAPALENIDYGLQQTQNQAGIQNNQFDLQQQNLDLQKNQLQQSVEDAIKQVKRNEADQQSNFTNQQQRLGIRQSGLTDTGLNQIGADTTTNLNRLELNRANNLAQLALQGANLNLQKAGATNSLASAVRQAQMQRNDVNSQIQSAINGNNQQDFGNEIQKFQLSQGLPVDQSGFLGRFGFIQGQKPLDLNSSGLADWLYAPGSDEQAYQQYLQATGGR